jgi:hypothetical protein
MAAAVGFPSVEWFEVLGKLMDQQRDLHMRTGTIDCVAQFTVFEATPHGGARHFQVTFEEFSVTRVDEVDDEEVDRADFVLEADLDIWQEMIENIAAGNGRPDLEHSLNRLSLPGTPMRAWSEDPLRRDLFFRFNQSLQEFFNASAEISTIFPESR